MVSTVSFCFRSWPRETRIVFFGGVRVSDVPAADGEGDARAVARGEEADAEEDEGRLVPSDPR
jgi:hypothetical protein